MPGVYQLEWRNGRIETIYGHRGYYYVLDGLDGLEILTFLPVPAWCHVCAKIPLCEKLESPEAIQADLDQLEDPESEMSRQLRRSSLSDFPARWKRRRTVELALVTKRTEPAMCLTCGERRVSHFTADAWMAHPGTGEEVRLSSSGMCSTGFAMKFYDPDGHPVDVDADEKKRLLANGYL